MLVTFNRRPDQGRTAPPDRPFVLGPHDALRLAVLGVAAYGPISLDALIASVGRIGGAAWQPCADVILDSVRALLLRGLLSDSEMTTPGVSPVLTITPSGYDDLTTLLRAKPSPGWSQLGDLVTTLTVAFLDLLSASDRNLQVDRVIRYLEEQRESWQDQIGTGPRVPPCVARAGTRDRARIDSDIAWLRSLRSSVPGPSISKA